MIVNNTKGPQRPPFQFEIECLFFLKFRLKSNRPLYELYGIDLIELLE
jgi:hypothetical protein